MLATASGAGENGEKHCSATCFTKLLIIHRFVAAPDRSAAPAPTSANCLSKKKTLNTDVNAGKL